MADEIKTYIMCPRCLGTGIYTTEDSTTHLPIVEDPCTNCGGAGYFETGKTDTTEIMDELDWIKKKIKKILNKLEIEEE
jgi:DnaJ-class molecular chaperone